MEEPLVAASLDAGLSLALGPTSLGGIVPAPPPTPQSTNTEATSAPAFGIPLPSLQLGPIVNGILASPTPVSTDTIKPLLQASIEAGVSAQLSLPNLNGILPTPTSQGLDLGLPPLDINSILVGALPSPTVSQQPLIEASIGASVDLNPLSLPSLNGILPITAPLVLLPTPTQPLVEVSVGASLDLNAGSLVQGILPTLPPLGGASAGLGASLDANVGVDLPSLDLTPTNLVVGLLPTQSPVIDVSAGLGASVGVSLGLPPLDVGSLVGGILPSQTPIIALSTATQEPLIEASAGLSLSLEPLNIASVVGGILPLPVLSQTPTEAGSIEASSVEASAGVGVIPGPLNIESLVGDILPLQTPSPVQSTSNEASSFEASAGPGISLQPQNIA